MAQSSQPGTPETAPTPDVSHLITEDGKPVDSFLSEKQMRLLTEPLYASWKAPGGRFIAAANVGVFAVARNPAIVPDVFVSVDVDPPPLTGPERLRSYFIWEFGKAPDIAIEIVSDTVGGELSDKLREYERMRITHYVVFDPLRKLGAEELMAFTFDGGRYVLRTDATFEKLDLGLVVWDGSFEGIRERWLRWTAQGKLIPTGTERADEETRLRQSAEAELERLRAELEALKQK